MSAREIIRKLALWGERPQVDVLAGGFSNENFRVTAQGRSYFARAGTDVPRHAICRANEYACARLAADAGVAPAVMHADDGVLVTQFVHGQTLRLGQLLTPAQLAAIAKLLATVHHTVPVGDIQTVDLVRSCRSYLEKLERSSAAAGLRDRAAEIISAAPRAAAEAFIHGDAFPENFIDNGQRMWLVDWEFAGRGDPAIDLAFVAMNFELSEDRMRLLLDAYHGNVSLATVQALVPLAALRDALWCLAEMQSQGTDTRLADYTQLCLGRLGLEGSFR